MKMQQEKKQIPNIESRLRHNILEMPKEIRKASGIDITYTPPSTQELFKKR